MQKNTDVKICFISSRTGLIKSDHEVLMDTANGLLIESLSKQYGDNFSLAIISVREQKKSFDKTVSVGRLFPLPIPFSYTGGFSRSFRVYSVLKRIAASHDILIIQLPFIGFLSLPFINRPTVYHICANVLTAASNPVKYTGLKRIVSRSFAGLMHSTYRFLFRRRQVKVLANGKELAELYKAKMIVSTSILTEDIMDEARALSKKHSQVELLFVGRPSLEKGFDTLMEALTMLTVDFRLSVVGFSEEEFAALLPEVFSRSATLLPRLDFKGYMGWNNGLRSILESSDIAIVPSRSEGTPRVILECMSQGVVVIGSCAGGIPTIIEDGTNGLLVTPGDAAEIAEKIKFLASNTEARKKLISCGLKTVSGNTLDKFAGHFRESVQQLING